MKRILFICILFFAASAQAQTFTKKADFPGGTRHKMMSVALGTKVYVGAGQDSNGVLFKDFWQYEATTNTWTKKNDIPFTARRNVSAVVINGTIYAGFGWDGTSSLSDWWMYNTSSDTWVQKAGFNAAGRYWSGLGEWNGEGYLVCGGSGQSGSFVEYKDVWKYNPTTNTWTAQPNFSGTARNGSFCQILGNKLYFGLGVSSSASTYRSDVFKYNLSTQTWSAIAPLPASANIPVVDGYSTWSANYGGKIVLMNIDLDAPTLAEHNHIYIYDTSSSSWTRYPMANTASYRLFGISAQTGSKAYAGLGFEVNSGTWYSDMWEVNLASLATSVEDANPYLSKINIFRTSSAIQTQIPQAVFDQNGTLTLDIFSTEGKKLGHYQLQENKSIDITTLASANYIYQLQSAKTPLKSGFILLQ
ncbi:MAG: hypothetical protein JSS78_00190 [Bacteroidetes bacterium]|nr:hypothetical protein [Bacteroidota bacterium]